MSANDVILLSDMIENSRSETSALDKPTQEAYFVAKHYLRTYRPTHDDLLAGIVDGTLDGGIDNIYIFVNGFCVRDDAELHALGRDAQVDLIFMQTKDSKGFGESAIEKLIIHIPQLLDFGRDEDELANRFNPRVLEITRRFLKLYRSLEMPKLRIFCSFAALRAEMVHANVESKAILLRDCLLTCFKTCEPMVHFLDAADIADMARDRPPVSRELALAENPISTDTTGGYIGVVKLSEYQRFITDATGKLDASIFEANVRDYEGDTGVNKSIQATLEHENREVDFWWLNNGVTIVADKVQPASKLLKLESPQIVNGLQTSHEIYKRGTAASFQENRSVLVKVIQADDDRVRDSIIQATNSQTALGTSALRATDKVQRQIEEHLQKRGLFYERRKNYYHNRSIALTQLVSIDQMGQAVMSTLVQVPHLARGASSRIFDNEIYPLVFNEEHPIQLYSYAIELVRHCEAFLKRSAPREHEDFVFHLAMLAAVAATRKDHPKSRDIARIEGLPEPSRLTELLQIVREEFAYVQQRTGAVLLDRVAKDPLTSKRLQDRAQRFLRTSPR
ncbi:AIPR family protein [Aeromicrobium massiliense]|uniref:AIPR family protein n=1 Tax=Aeromicrobium massiliense TaxID=1464554 RepID=UPI0005781F3B|nr:AIPR family protein [Aeromicrobium massiliense]